MGSAEAKHNPKHYGGNLEGFRAHMESTRRRSARETAAAAAAHNEDAKTPRGMPAALEPLYMAPPAAPKPEVTGQKGSVALPPRAASPNWPSAGPEWVEPDPVASGQRLRHWQAYDGPSGAGAVGVGELVGGAVSSTARRVRVDSRLSWLDKGEPTSRLSHSSFVSPRGGWTATPSSFGGGGWNSQAMSSAASLRDGEPPPQPLHDGHGHETYHDQSQSGGGLDANLSSASINSSVSFDAGSSHSAGRSSTKEQWSYESIAAVPPVLRRLPAEKPRAVDHNLKDTRSGLDDLEWAQEGQMGNLYSYLEAEKAKEGAKKEEARRYARQGF
jgi:hypothetical protein